MPVVEVALKLFRAVLYPTLPLNVIAPLPELMLKFVPVKLTGLPAL